MRKFIKLATLVAATLVSTGALAQQSWKKMGVLDNGATDNQLCRYIGDLLYCDTTSPSVSATGMVGISTTAPAASLDVSTTDALIVPRGASADQPASPVNGMIRYNTDNNVFEAYENGAWANIATSTSSVSSIDDLSDAKHDTDDYSSLFLGNGAGANDDGTANLNIGVGKNAMAANTSGSANTALGPNALAANTTGSQNLAIGTDALKAAAGASQNTAVGSYALDAENSGNANTAVGAQALSSHTGGANNVALGAMTLSSNLTGSNNIAIGAYNLAAATGDSNISIGTLGATNLTSGGNNIAIGNGVGVPNATASNQFIVGTLATGNFLHGNMGTGKLGIGGVTPTVSLEIAGTDAVQLTSGTTAERPGSPANGMIRYNTDLNSFEAYENSAWASVQTSASAVTEINDLSDAATDSTSIFLGSGAGANDDGLNINIALGLDALNSNTSGQYNTAIGRNVLFSNVAGSGNTAFGVNALLQVEGSSNVAIGRAAGITQTNGDFNIAIGAGAQFPNPTGSNQFVVSDSLNGMFLHGDLANKRLAIGSVTPTVSLEVAGTDAVQLTSGTTAERPASPTNGMIRYNSDNSKFEAYENGAWADMITASSPVWENNAGVVRPVSGTVDYTADDFLFGSPTLAYDANVNHSARMFFDKSKSAFRAGSDTAGDWNDANVGANSIVIGTGKASGTLSSVIGTGIASGIASTAIAGATASGFSSVAIGSNSVASGGTSFAIGGNAKATSTNSTAFGNLTTSSGIASTAMGYSTTASGNYSTSMGSFAQANGATSLAFGGGVQADGDYSIALGLSNAVSGTSVAANTMGIVGGSVAIGAGSADATLDVSATDAIIVARGTTAERPGTPTNGMIRYNTDLNSFEAYENSAWASVSTSSSTVSAIDDLSDAASDGSSVFLGSGAGANDSGTRSSVGVGINALNAQSAGEQNVAVGKNSMAAIQLGGYNTAVGTDSLAVATGGTNNVAIGHSAIGNGTATAGSNVAVGYSALYSVIGGSNTAIGDSALWQHASGGPGGTSNVAIGASAGATQTAGSRNILIGAGVSAPDPTASSQFVVGDSTNGTFLNGDIANKRLAIGNITPTVSLEIAGTDAVQLTSGTTAERPGSPANGMIRYNTDTAKFEGYENGAWADMIGGGSSLWTDNTTHISREGIAAVSGTYTGVSALASDLEGAGTRMFFDPATGSFRAGQVNGSQWDDSNIGNVSTAMGYRNTASGAWSVAIGSQSQATGNSTIVIGESSSATNNTGLALGINAKSSGAAGIAVGKVVEAAGGQSLAVGKNLAATGLGAMAMGVSSAASATVSGDYSVGIFAGDSSAQDVTQNGVIALMGGNVGVGIATPTTALHVEGDLRGTNVGSRYLLDSDDGGHGSFSLYNGAQTRNVKLDSVGDSYLLGGDLGLGTSTPAATLDVSSTDALIVARGTAAERPGTPANGMIRYNTDTAKFEGYENGAWANVVTGAGTGLWTDNTTHISREGIAVVSGTYTGTSALAADVESAGVRMFFDPATATLRAGITDATRWSDANIGNYSVALGAYTTSSADYAVSIGRSTNATASHALAMGRNTTASGDNSVALGYGNTASNWYSTAMGYGTTASGHTAFSAGYGTIASGSRSVALGDFSQANGTNSFAFGAGVQADGDYSVAIGLSNGVSGTSVPANTMAIMGGSVGINVASPTGALHVAYAGGTEDTDPLYVTINNTTNQGSSFIKFREDAASTIGTNSEYGMDVGYWSAASSSANEFRIQGFEGSGGLTGNIFSIDRSTGYVGINTADGVKAQAALDVSTTDAIIVARGTTAQRPGSPVNGMIRYNTDDNLFEVYQNSAWGNLAGATDIGGLSDVSATSVAAATDGQVLTYNNATSEWISADAATGLWTDNTTHISREGIVAVSGTYTGTSALPSDLEGSGTRMWFDPATAAFRAGGVTAGFWDDGNIGMYSAALGTDNTASGLRSFAVGQYAAATGSDSIAIGESATASGNVATAIGVGNSATTGGDMALGAYSTASGGESITLGSHTYTSGLYSLAAGRYAQANGSTSLAFGHGVQADGDYSIALGLSNGVSGTSVAANTMGIVGGSVAIGAGSAQATLDVSTTDALIVPRGTTAQQPGTPVNGMIRYNTDDSKFEVYENGAWANIVYSIGALSTHTDVSTTAATDGQVLTWDNTASEWYAADAVGGASSVNDLTDGKVANSGIFVGTLAGNAITTGGWNVAFGESALQKTQASNGNTAMGYAALKQNVSGAHNSAFGYNALTNSTGASNIALGYTAGDNLTAGDSNIIIGNGDFPSATGSDQLVIGSAIYGDMTSGSEKISIGTSVTSVGLDVATTDAVKVASGTTAQRPGSPANGMIRYNTDTNKFEAYENGAWADMIGGGSSLWTDNTTHISRVGIVAVSGTYTATSALPADMQGAGTRMFFDPTTAAFRAGYVGGNHWDDANMGNYSFAAGQNVKASGANSFTFGQYSLASAANSVALGGASNATGNASLAMANGIASGGGAIAMGSGTNSTALRSIAMGSNTRAAADYGIALGSYAQANGNTSFAFGAGVQADGAYSIALGLSNAVSGTSVAANTMGIVGGSVAIGAGSADATLDVSATDAIIVARGTTLERPTATNGMIRYNTDTSKFEAYEAGAWANIVDSLWTDNTTYISKANVHILDSGNMGIGTTSPAVELDIRGSIYGTDAGAKRYRLLNNDGGHGGLEIYDGAQVKVMHFDGYGTSYFNAGAVKVGIGTTTPTDELEVNGGITTVTLTYSSDKKWKKNIETIDDSLEKILSLRGVSYDWRADEFVDKKFPEGKQIGLIAQEVEEVFPEVVSEKGDGKTVNYAALVAPLIEAVKAQQKQIDELRAEIKTLKGE